MSSRRLEDCCEKGRMQARSRNYPLRQSEKTLSNSVCRQGMPRLKPESLNLVTTIQAQWLCTRGHLL